mmetsp:Transcript_52689/g.140390  ORF Transcript_52689/g.140390 Transcript_52689/m.140390 type:complete len:211 (-) Transcript_52689:677-1309(-)
MMTAHFCSPTSSSSLSSVPGGKLCGWLRRTPSSVIEATSVCTCGVMDSTSSPKSVKGISLSVGHAEHGGEEAMSRAWNWRPYSRTMVAMTLFLRSSLRRACVLITSTSLASTASALPTWAHCVHRAASHSQAPAQMSSLRSASTRPELARRKYSRRPEMTRKASVAAGPPATKRLSPGIFRCRSRASPQMSCTMRQSTKLQTRMRGCFVR